MLPFLNKNRMASAILDRKVIESGEVVSDDEGSNVMEIVLELRALADRLEAMSKENE